MNAPIRLASALLLALSSLLSSACAGGTRAGTLPPRLVREPLLVDDGASRAVAAPSVQATRQPEHVRSGVTWSVNAVR